MANTVVPDDRYTHKDANGNVVYNMTDKDYRDWSSCHRRTVRHEDINKNYNYVRVYNNY